MNKYSLLVSALIAGPAFATNWTTTINPATYTGSSGSITFNDGGYTGPTGVGANDFQVGSGFDAARVGQVQKVVTKDPDWLTSDPGHEVTKDITDPTYTYTNGNMDATVNFYQWAYTTGRDSTFNNMQIDKAGNYYIAKADMSFKTYDIYQYKDIATPPNSPLVPAYDTKINFKPYTVSDAKGWCGSVLTSAPSAVERMAGQVTFDIAFDVYFDYQAITGFPLADTFSSTQLIPDFVMRSYGSYDVSVSTASGEMQHYTGSAVENNTNPETGLLDSNYANQVSFLGGGVIPGSVWVSADSFNLDGSRKMRTDTNSTTGAAEQVWDVTIVEAGTAGAVLHTNAFGGRAFLMRADGTRILTDVGGLAVDDPANDFATNRAAWTDYASPAPEPETYAMMLAGLGLVGFAARRRNQRV